MTEMLFIVHSPDLRAVVQADASGAGEDSGDLSAGDLYASIAGFSGRARS